MKNKMMIQMYDQNTFGKLRAMAFLRFLKRMMIEVETFYLWLTHLQYRTNIRINSRIGLSDF